MQPVVPPVLDGGLIRRPPLPVAPPCVPLLAFPLRLHLPQFLGNTGVLLSFYPEQLPSLKPGPGLFMARTVSVRLFSHECQPLRTSFSLRFWGKDIDLAWVNCPPLG